MCSFVNKMWVYEICTAWHSVFNLHFTWSPNLFQTGVVNWHVLGRHGYNRKQITDVFFFFFYIRWLHPWPGVCVQLPYEHACAERCKRRGRHAALLPHTPSWASLASELKTTNKSLYMDLLSKLCLLYKIYNNSRPNIPWRKAHRSLSFQTLC